jgi:ribosomal protein L11 methyltransferase
MPTTRLDPNRDMTSTLTPQTHRATLTIGDEASARRVSDLLTETLDEGNAAVGAFEGPGGRWDVTFYFADRPNEAAIRELVALAAGEDAGRAVKFDTVEPKDWVKATLDELVPVHAGRFVVHGQHDRARVAPNKLGIEIEAALAFGTGHHGTTRGCLLLLGHVLKAHRPRRLLDLGTGSGVLAIAAAKALRGQVLASDIDALSVTVAAENARANGVGPFVKLTWGNGFSAPGLRERQPFDLVLANILANPLRQMATPMSRHLAGGARVILSGLLSAQAPAVIAAYRARGLILERQIRIEGWSSLMLCKV